MKLPGTITTLFGLAALAAASLAYADRSGMRAYEVTITNLTKGQVFSPPVLVTHRPSIALFELGAPALPELATVAEDGAGGPLADLLNSLPDVSQAQATPAPIPAGASATYLVEGSGRSDVLSIAGMLVNTNDAFFAGDSLELPTHRQREANYHAPAYDAGSEGNNEDCAFVPGPACPEDSGNARSVDDAEGYVHVHNGIHGIADLAPYAYDWRNPVVRIAVRRIR